VDSYWVSVSKFIRLDCHDVTCLHGSFLKEISKVSKIAFFWDALCGGKL
jgi:hypothetical protein